MGYETAMNPGPRATATPVRAIVDARLVRLLIGALLASLFWILPEPSRADDMDLSKLAQIAEGYWKSIQTLRFRSRTSWPEERPRRLDPTLYGPGTIAIGDFAKDGDRVYMDSNITEEGKPVRRSQAYQLGLDQYLIRRSPNVDDIVQVMIKREPIRGLPVILFGLFDAEGAVHERLRSERTALLGTVESGDSPNVRSRRRRRSESARGQDRAAEC